MIKLYYITDDPYILKCWTHWTKFYLSTIDHYTDISIINYKRLQSKTNLQAEKYLQGYGTAFMGKIP